MELNRDYQSSSTRSSLPPSPRPFATPRLSESEASSPASSPLYSLRALHDPQMQSAYVAPASAQLFQSVDAEQLPRLEFQNMGLEDRPQSPQSPTLQPEPVVGSRIIDATTARPSENLHTQNDEEREIEPPDSTFPDATLEDAPPDVLTVIRTEGSEISTADARLIAEAFQLAVEELRGPWLAAARTARHDYVNARTAVNDFEMLSLRVRLATSNFESEVRNARISSLQARLADVYAQGADPAQPESTVRLILEAHRSIVAADLDVARAALAQGRLELAEAELASARIEANECRTRRDLAYAYLDELRSTCLSASLCHKVAQAVLQVTFDREQDD